MKKHPFASCVLSFPTGLGRPRVGRHSFLLPISMKAHSAAKCGEKLLGGVNKLTIKHGEKAEFNHVKACLTMFNYV